MTTADKNTAARRLPRAERRLRLLATARAIVREEGADRLTLGRLAIREGVSKPVVYDHFPTRSALLIELYRSLDTEYVAAVRSAYVDPGLTFTDAATGLAYAYVHCAVLTGEERQSVGAALSGSTDMTAVYRELLDGYVQLLISVFARHVKMGAAELERRCIGLIGAGESLCAVFMRGGCSEAEAATTYSAIMRGGFADALA